MSFVPRVFHQIWFNFTPGEWGILRSPPAKYDPFMASWRKVNPKWRAVMWNEHSAEQLMQRCYPSWLAKFRGLPEPIQRADLFRWVALYHFGGCYADLDTRCLAALDKRLEQTFGSDGGLARGHLLALPQSGWACNALIVSTRLNPAVKEMIDSMGRPWLSRSVVGTFFSTGPARVHFRLQQLARKGHLIVRDPLLLHHVPDGEKQQEGVLAVHEGHGSWDFGHCWKNDLLRLILFVVLIVACVTAAVFALRTRKVFPLRELHVAGRS